MLTDIQKKVLQTNSEVNISQKKIFKYLISRLDTEYRQTVDSLNS